MPLPSTFELTVESTTTEDEYRLVAEYSRAGGLPVRSERTCVIDPSTLQAHADSAAYGQALGRMLFVDGVRELFAQARVDAEHLRVLLAVEARALQPLRWERLAAPFSDDQWLLLGHSQRTPLSLYLPSSVDRRFPPFGRRDLRALVVVASPEPGNKYKVEPFDEARAIDTALEGLGTIPSTVLGKDPRAEGPPTLREIGRRLTSERYTLIHVVCHGAFSARTGETAVFLDDDDGKTHAAKATAIIHGFKELGTTKGLPHFAFLAVCDSAKPEAESTMGGLGQRLVRELGMPAVVAMTERVSQETAMTLGQGLYTRLREHGEVDRALVEACVEVRARTDSVVPALFSRLAGRPLFSDDLDRRLTHSELVAGAELLDALVLERAPVLREHTRELAAAVTVDPELLRGQAAREHAQSLAELENLCENVLELSFSALAHGREPPPYTVRCPFPGLRAFTADQRQFFRGRDALVQTLLGQLEQRPFLAVLGNSGCGKSSLVMAGVVPRLRDTKPALQAVHIKPGEHPLSTLEKALEQLEGADESVLYVDQFEESFTLCRDELEREKFFDRLLGAVSDAHRVIISMRADFIGECAQHKELRKQVEGLRLIPPMSADELRNAVEEQGRAAGLRYETGLCELILEDLADEPGAMPLLQHALQQLYEHRHGRWLRVQAYQDLGRVQRAITMTAESVWEHLDEADQGRLCGLMLELTEVREAEGGGPARYLRRRVPLSSLYRSRQGTIAPFVSHSTSLEEAAVKRLVDLLADERLLVKSRDERLGPVVEVAHEALLSGWERLQEWLAAALDSIRLRQDLEHATARWRAHDRSPAYLEHVHERGDRVRSFLREGTLKLDPRLEEYFAACEAEEQRRREEKERQQQEKLEAAERLAAEQTRRVKTLRRSAIIVGAAAVAALVLAATAFWFYRRANEGERKATLAQAKAEEQAELANIAEGKATRALETQKGLTAELMATQPGHRIQALQDTIALSRPDPRSPSDPLRVAELPIEVRRALFASTQGLHAARELIHAEGHAVVDLAFSPDGQRLATAGRDGTAKLWAVPSGKRLATIEGHGGEERDDDVEHVSFVPTAEGQQLLTVGADGTARLWWDDGRPNPHFIEPEGHVVAAVFSPDHRQVATATDTGAVTVWTQEFGLLRPNPALEEQGHPVTHLEYAPTGSHLLVVHQGQLTAWVLDVSSPAIHAVELLGHEAAITAVAVVPDGTGFATGDARGEIRLWDARSGELRQTVRGTGEVKALALSPSGDRLAAALERIVELWHLGREEKLATLRGHRAYVRDLAFSPDGRRLATVSWDKALRLWDVSTGDTADVLEGHVDYPTRVVFSPDGKRIATADEGGSVRVWQAESGTHTTLLGSQGPGITHMALSPDGSRVLLATEDDTTIRSLTGEPDVVLDMEYLTTVIAWSPSGKLAITVDTQNVPAVWDGRTGEHQVNLPQSPQIARSVAFSPNEDVLAVGDVLGGVWVFELKTQQWREIGAHEQLVTSVAFSPDGRMLATGSADLTARAWPLDGKGPARPPLRHPKLPYYVTFDPDGEHLVTADFIGMVRRWRLGSDQPPEEFGGHLAVVNAIAFSSTGKYMITGGDDSSVRLWDVEAGEEISSLGTHPRSVLSVRFVNGNREVLSGSRDGSVQRWVVDSQQRMRFACEALEGQSVDDPEVMEIMEICRSVLGRATSR